MNKPESVCIIGLGYVGLPLSIQVARQGCRVVGIDSNEKRVDCVNKREVSDSLHEQFMTSFKSIPLEQLGATSSYDEIQEVSHIVICVPTPTEEHRPDLSFVEEASRQIGQRLKVGQVVLLESTVNPGVTRGIVLPILERESGLTVGKDFFLAHCPERVDPGNEKLHVGNINRVVGGITDECSERARTFYGYVIDGEVTVLSSAEEAEFVKSWENSHRNVMIALANSAAIICDALGMNIDNILKGMQSKVDQFGLQLARPGIGPGGHCIPEDIHYVIKSARQNGVDTRLLDTATELNERMPSYAIAQLMELVRLNGESLADLRVCLLGLTYKPNVADRRRSPAIDLGYQLIRHVRSVGISDPYIKDRETIIRGAKNMSSLQDAVEYADVIVIGTGHEEYIRELKPERLKRAGVRYILDGRNCLDGKTMVAAGIKYKGIGR